jgi:tetratricopeptide (TPR) repeat protein
MWPPWVFLGRQGAHIGAPLQTLCAIALLFLAMPGFAAASTPPPVRVLSAAGVAVESAALLMSGQEGGELPVGIVLLPVPGLEGKTRLLVRLRIGGPELLVGQTGDVLRTDVCLYVLDAGEGVQAALLETVEIDLAALRGAVEQSGIDVLGSLELRPGPYSLRMLARNSQTGRLGVRTLALTVPDPATVDPSPPLLPPPAEGDLRVTARSATLGPLDPPPFPEDDAAPVGAAPALAARKVPAAPSIPDTVEGRKLRSAIRTAYRDALGLWAAGQEADALGAVAALEDSLLRRSEAPVRADEILEMEIAFGRELAAVDVESLLPLLRFHRRLHEEATNKKRFIGSTIAREVFLGLAETCREGGRPELARRFETTFAITLLRQGSRSRAGQIFSRVLAEEPGNEAILLELAADAERRADRAGAIDRLDALLRLQPDHGEARLRKALDQGQLGRTAEATEELRSLIRDETGGWRLRVAYHELARLLLADRRPEEAQRVLREGLQRLPGDEKLTILLAATLERNFHRSEAGDVLAALRPEGRDGGGTARRRYNHPPQGLHEALVADLDREAASRLPNLVTALERTK